MLMFALLCARRVKGARSVLGECCARSSGNIPSQLLNEFASAILTTLCVQSEPQNFTGTSICGKCMSKVLCPGLVICVMAARTPNVSLHAHKYSYQRCRLNYSAKEQKQTLPGRSQQINTRQSMNTEYNKGIRHTLKINHFN